MTDPARREVPAAEVALQLERLGVERGGVLLVHTSFRAVRPIEGGPAGLIGALRQALGPDGTLVMPSWTGEDDEPFDPARSAADEDDLGVTADVFWRMPGVMRSDHPFAFAAAGPRAEEIIGDPLPIPPHGPPSPVGRVHDVDGQVLLLGVGHDSNTTVHLAESMAAAPYSLAHHVTVLSNGRPTRVDYREPDHCCERFALLDDWLDIEGLQSYGMVGHARARLARSRDIVRLAVEALQGDPLLFLHPAGVCEECDDAHRSLPY